MNQFFHIVGIWLAFATVWTVIIHSLLFKSKRPKMSRLTIEKLLSELQKPQTFLN